MVTLHACVQPFVYLNKDNYISLEQCFSEISAGSIKKYREECVNKRQLLADTVYFFLRNHKQYSVRVCQ